MERKKIIIQVLIILTVVASILLPGHIRLKNLRKENTQYKKRIKILSEHNNDLEKELARVKEDPDYIEQKARNKLGIVKKGEIIYRGKAE